MHALRSALDGANGERPTVDLRLWRLDLLRDSRLRDMADADVGRTDMLLLAVEGADSLPSAMDSWLKMLGSEEESARGFALLVKNDPRTDCPTRDDFRALRSKAEASRVGFITNIARSRDASHGKVALGHAPVVSRRRLFGDFDHVESSRAWGIND